MGRRPQSTSFSPIDKRTLSPIFRLSRHVLADFTSLHVVTIICFYMVASPHVLSQLYIRELQETKCIIVSIVILPISSCIAFAGYDNIVSGVLVGRPLTNRFVVPTLQLHEFANRLYYTPHSDTKRKMVYGWRCICRLFSQVVDWLATCIQSRGGVVCKREVKVSVSSLVSFLFTSLFLGLGGLKALSLGLGGLRARRTVTSVPAGAGIFLPCSGQIFV